MRLSERFYSASFVCMFLFAGLLGSMDRCHAQDPAIRHCDYQLDDPQFGGYQTPVPFRMFGVVLNNTEDWLDPTEDFDNSGAMPPYMGGEAEIFLQAVDLDGTPYDPYPDPGQAGESDPLFGDFGGTFVWIGQNYGNLPFVPDLDLAYIDLDMVDDPGETRPAWYDELDRLGFWRPGTPLDPSALVRAGDLVEVRALVNGLVYQGKHNVNERHTIDPQNNFEIVILQKDYGLPDPESLHLDALKDTTDQFYFDPKRATGGEHYQGSYMTIENVWFDGLTAGDPLVTDTWYTVTDEAGRTLEIYLGLSPSFDAMMLPAGPLNLTGVLDQQSESGQDGYRLLVMQGSAIAGTFTADFDMDDDIDGNDFLVWQTGLGIDGSGDANGDGVTTGDDLLIWSEQFGSGPIAAFASVPEPAGFGLWIMVACILLVGFRSPGNRNSTAPIRELDMPNALVSEPLPSTSAH